MIPIATFRGRYEAEFGTWPIHEPEADAYFGKWLSEVPDTILDDLFQKTREILGDSRKLPRLGEFRKAFDTIRQEKGISGHVSDIDSFLKFIAQFRGQEIRLLTHKADPHAYRFRVLAEDDLPNAPRVYFVPEEPWLSDLKDGKRVPTWRTIPLRDWLFESRKAGVIDLLKERIRLAIKGIRPNAEDEKIDIATWLQETMNEPSQGNTLHDALKAWTKGNVKPIKALEKEAPDQTFYAAIIKAITGLSTLKPMKRVSEAVPEPGTMEEF